jgi:alkaline phosphatase D
MKSSDSSFLKRRLFLAWLGAGLSALRVCAETFGRRFKVTLAQAHIGNLEIDTQLLDSYGALPASIRQFYLDARAAFAANPVAGFSDPAIVRAARVHGLPLMGGPMLGDLRADGITMWLRPATAEPLAVTADGKSFRVEKVQPGVEQKIRLNGLNPDTACRYVVLAGKQVVAEGGFTTAPVKDDKGVFRIAFGSCMHKIGVHNSILVREILKREPRAMLLLGDIAVDDRENQINMHRADYQLRDVSLAWKKLAANVPLYACWDDHDYFNNDLNGIPKGFTASDRDAVRAVWRQNWNNPPADDGREGIWFSTRIGPVEIIMLDTRSCRDNERRRQYGSYLGEQQMEWLKDTLKSSTAPFKVISSGTMWSDYVTKAKDSWGSWDTAARKEIFSLIEKEKIGGVLLISGDRHGARAFRIPRPSGFNFHEFEAATLGGVPGPPGLVENCPEQLFGYDGKDFIAFGEFTFDTTGKQPQATFRLINENGAVLEEHAIPYADLVPGRYPVPQTK